MTRLDDLPSETDVISIGSGAAGCAAALAAAQRGLRSVLLEKGETLGGGTAYSLGGLWAPCNRFMAEAGRPDIAADAERYMAFLAGGAAEAANMQAYLHDAAPTLDEFEAAGMRFRAIGGFPDHYYPSAPGSSAEGRSLEAEPITDAELGRFAGYVHDSPYLQRGLSWSDAVAWGGFGGVRGWDKDEMMRRRARGQLGAGQALVGQFLAALGRSSASVVNGFAVTELIMEQGRVAGVRGVMDGAEREIRAARGVVIATGGYEGSPEMIRQFEGLPGWVNMFPVTVAGDGLVMALELGAALYRLPANLRMMLGYIEPAEEGRAPGFRVAGPRILSFPHSLVVNQRGARFADESQFQHAVPAIQQFEPTTHEFANLPCFMIFDQSYLDRYSFAGRDPGAPPPAWLASAATPGELAGRLGISRDGLEATLDAFNAEAAQGRDPVFGRGASSWSQSTAGDRAHPINPNLAPVESAPFYGLQLSPSGIGSAGLMVDEWARVLHVRGRPIAGLYAAGNAAAPCDYGVGYQAGLSLMSGMIFGRRAVMDLARDN